MALRRPSDIWNDNQVTLDVGDTLTLSGNVTLDAGSLVGVRGNITLSDSKGFIGLVTATSINAGTNKTLTTLPLLLSTASIQTVVTPTNAQVIKLTSLVLSSDATVRVSIKSGVTYLTGNASIGIVLNPAGGFVQVGSPDSPIFIGCASGPLNVEKFDMTGTKANIGGNVTYFQE